MEEGLQRLPEDLRTVFILRDQEGHSNADVAEMLDLTVAAVKSRLHRARIVLRDRLDRYFRDKMTRRDRPRPSRPEPGGGAAGRERGAPRRGTKGGSSTPGTTHGGGTA
jgi:hypothetical protein